MASWCIFGSPFALSSKTIERPYGIKFDTKQVVVLATNLIGYGV
jgi:hypothetical protein